MVEVAVEYRSPANSQRFIGAFDKPSVLHCVRASEIAYWRRQKNPRPKPPFPHVTVTAGLPRSLVWIFGHSARAYRYTVVPFPRGRLLFYTLHFGFRDASDPHVAYYVSVYDTNNEAKHQLETDAALARRSALRVIYATR